MSLTGPQARAARALIEWPLEKVADLAGLAPEALTAFERGKVDPGAEARAALRAALERGGAVFIEEADGLGLGVRLKWSRRDARQLNRLENEGGPVADDDVV